MRMSSAEFTDWIAYANLEPFGYDIENYRAGIIASTVANVAPRKRGSRPLKPDDFYPQRAPPKTGPGMRAALAEKRRRNRARAALKGK
jgi:hypothetical protein